MQISISLSYVQQGEKEGETSGWKGGRKNQIKVKELYERHHKFVIILKCHFNKRNNARKKTAAIKIVALTLQLCFFLLYPSLILSYS